MKRNRKWKIPHMLSERWILCFGSCKNHKLKVELWWVGARERKKSAFFVMFILSEGNFCNICVFSQFIVYWIHFQNTHSFTYQKTLLHVLFLFIFKIVESLQCILKTCQMPKIMFNPPTFLRKNMFKVINKDTRTTSTDTLRTARK